MPEPWIEKLVDDVLDKHGIGKAQAPICPSCKIPMEQKSWGTPPELFQCKLCQRIEAR